MLEVGQMLLRRDAPQSLQYRYCLLNLSFCERLFAQFASTICKVSITISHSFFFFLNILTNTDICMLSLTEQYVLLVIIIWGTMYIMDSSCTCRGTFVSLYVLVENFLCI